MPRKVPESAVIKEARVFKDRLLSRDAELMKTLTNRWVGVERSIQKSMEDLAHEITALRADGRAPSRNQLYRMERYQQLLAQAREEMAKYNGSAASTILDATHNSVHHGLSDAADLLDTSLRESGLALSFGRLNTDAVMAMMGATAWDWSALNKLLSASYPESVVGLTNALITGMAKGLNARVIAAQMADGFGMGLNRSLRVARDQTMRSYRRASDEQYKSSEVVDAKQWVSSKSLRTCAGCLAMDGRILPLSEPSYDHVQGRCVTIPIVKGSEPKVYQTGEMWFRSLTASAQKTILGDERWQAWRKGEFPFSALGGVKESKIWGKSVRIPSLKDLVERSKEPIVPLSIGHQRMGFKGVAEVTTPGGNVFKFFDTGVEHVFDSNGIVESGKWSGRAVEKFAEVDGKVYFRVPAGEIGKARFLHEDWVLSEYYRPFVAPPKPPPAVVPPPVVPPPAITAQKALNEAVERISKLIRDDDVKHAYILGKDGTEFGHFKGEDFNLNDHPNLLKNSVLLQHLPTDPTTYGFPPAFAVEDVQTAFLNGVSIFRSVNGLYTYTMEFDPNVARTRSNWAKIANELDNERLKVYKELKARNLSREQIAATTNHELYTRLAVKIPGIKYERVISSVPVPISGSNGVTPPPAIKEKAAPVEERVVSTKTKSKTAPNATANIGAQIRQEMLKLVTEREINTITWRAEEARKDIYGANYHNKKIIEITANVREKAHELLRSENPLPNTFVANLHGLPRALQDGVAFVQQTVDARLFPKKFVNYVTDTSGRAYHTSIDAKGVKHNVVADSKATKAGTTMAHELGHSIEGAIKGAQDKANEFLNRRTEGEKTAKLKDLFPGWGYEDKEIAKPDKFRDAYTGKVYTSGHTEVVSMGMQYLHEDPIRFAVEDPDFFDFIINLIRGGEG